MSRNGLFPTARGKGFVIYSRESVRRASSKARTSRATGKSALTQKPFYRLYYKNGLLTLERYRLSSRVFFSFYYKPDHKRVDRIRTMRRRGDSAKSFEAKRWQFGFGRDREERWADRGSKTVTDSEWLDVTLGGTRAIKLWIREQMRRKGCLIILIGSKTANRPWINYEIREGWNDLMGVVGVHVHNLKDNHGRQSPKGENPFNYLVVGGRPMSQIVKAYNPPYNDSNDVFNYIEQHLSSWVAQAIGIRNSTAAEAQYSERAVTIE
jgi:MTH538 TIR-like domain (DUF1863)